MKNVINVLIAYWSLIVVCLFLPKLHKLKVYNQSTKSECPHVTLV